MTQSHALPRSRQDKRVTLQPTPRPKRESEACKLVEPRKLRRCKATSAPEVVTNPRRRHDQPLPVLWGWTGNWVCARRLACASQPSNTKTTIIHSIGIDCTVTKRTLCGVLSAYLQVTQHVIVTAAFHVAAKLHEYKSTLQYKPFAPLHSSASNVEKGRGSALSSILLTANQLDCLGPPHRRATEGPLCKPGQLDLFLYPGNDAHVEI